MNLETIVELLAESVCEAPSLNRIGATVLELQAAADLVLILVKEIIQGLSHCRVINLRDLGKS